MNIQELSEAGKSRALQAIDQVAESQKLLNAQTAGAARHIFGLAKWACANSPDLATAADHFVALCRFAESERSTLTADKARIRVWWVLKSQAKRAMRNGVSPMDYPTLNALRSATLELLGKHKRRKRAPLTDRDLRNVFAASPIPKPMASVLQRIVITAQDAQGSRAVCAIFKKALKQAERVQTKTALKSAA